jgi:serine phosphatase RsbU (regulator of sigma subunit)
MLRVPFDVVLDPGAVVLLVEDDDGDALLVEELLVDADDVFTLVRARTMAEATTRGRRIDCALIDLGLPDAHGLEALQRFLAVRPGVAVVVLTGLADRDLALEAVGAGAQDYLIKGDVTGPQLGRILHYAMQRRRSDEAARQLLIVERRQAESDRMSRGLLAKPLIRDPAVLWATRYEPGGNEVIVGGDFFDSIELADGTIRAVIGDVCGHGPDEAAIGVALRIAWRTLVLAGHNGESVVQGMNELLRLERHLPDLFATVCDIEVRPDRRSIGVRLCGHPQPILLGVDPRLLSEARYGVALGVKSNPPVLTTEIALPAIWGLLLYTDGLFEGRIEGGDRLGLEGLVEMIGGFAGAFVGHALLDTLVDRVAQMNGGPLEDDVALMWLHTNGSVPGA